MADFDMTELTNKLAQLQKQVDQVNKMQGLSATSTQSTAPDVLPSSTYPRTIRTDTVEDILANPQWRAELQAEFATSDLGKKATMHAEILFAEFCEHATGKPSALLGSLRKEQEIPRLAAKEATKPPAASVKAISAKEKE